LSAPTAKDRRHAELAASFLSNLGVAYVAGAALQMILPALAEPAATATLFMVDGVGHIVVERSYGVGDDV
jgi:hypothetical protein